MYQIYRDIFTKIASFKEERWFGLGYFVNPVILSPTHNYKHTRAPLRTHLHTAKGLYYRVVVRYRKHSLTDKISLLFQLSSREDDLGTSGTAFSKKDGNSGRVILCCAVRRVDGSGFPDFDKH